ncbi:MAG: hypothetical protein ACOYLH_08690 [Flavobacteriales bacterium]
MNKVKTLLTALALFAGTALFAQNTITADEVNITITSETSREQLWQLRQEMQVQGIDFLYTPRFDNNRKLIGIEYTVKRSDGTVLGTASNNQLMNPNASSKIILAKQNNKFEATCIGTCE